MVLIGGAPFVAVVTAPVAVGHILASLTMALLSFLMGNNSNGLDRRWWFFAFYAFIGLGVLAKGPVAIALPA